jgi:hypothetical protein
MEYINQNSQVEWVVNIINTITIILLDISKLHETWQNIYI